jgi:hypothetical protein
MIPERDRRGQAVATHSVERGYRQPTNARIHSPCILVTIASVSHTNAVLVGQ